MEVSEKILTVCLQLQFLLLKAVSLYPPPEHLIDLFNEHESIAAKKLKIMKHRGSSSIGRMDSKELKAVGDLLDEEIVHYSVYGYDFETQKRKKGICLFTTEKINNFKPRIERYIDYLRYFVEYKNFSICHGIIIQVHENGVIGEVCDVKKNFKFYNIRCEQDNF